MIVWLMLLVVFTPTLGMFLGVTMWLTSPDAERNHGHE